MSDIITKISLQNSLNIISKTIRRFLNKSKYPMQDACNIFRYPCPICDCGELYFNEPSLIFCNNCGTLWKLPEDDPYFQHYGEKEERRDFVSLTAGRRTRGRIEW